MKYLCLGYHDEQAWGSLPEDERDALLEESFAYADLLRNSGHLIDDRFHVVRARRLIPRVNA